MSHVEVLRFRTMSDSELQTSLLDYRKEQFNLRFQKVNGQLTITSRVREVRRLIARVKTEQTTRVRGRVPTEKK